MSAPEKLECPSLFESRWVDLPEGVEVLDPATLPQGFRAGGVAAGIKPILVRDVADVAFGSRFRTGAATENGESCLNRGTIQHIGAKVDND